MTEEITEELFKAGAEVMSVFFGCTVEPAEMRSWDNHIYFEPAGPLRDPPPEVVWSQEWWILFDGQHVGTIRQSVSRRGAETRIRSQGGVRPLYARAILGTEGQA